MHKADNDTKDNALTLRRVMTMTEEEARRFVARIRWDLNNGDPICPKCGSLDMPYRITTRSKWKCRSCYHPFSEISGSCLASAKGTISQWLARAYVFASAAKGISSLQMSRTLSEQPRSSYFATMVMREAIAMDVEKLIFDTEVEIDGATFGGHRVHSAVAFEVNGNRRRFDNLNSKQRCVVVVIRQRGGRTAPFVGDRESDALPWIKRKVADGALIHCDGAHAWDGLEKLYELMRVEHKWEFVSTEGACTNSAESFFSRLRKMQHGTHHKIHKDNMQLYASENAWRVDHSHLSNTDRTIELMKILLAYQKGRAFRSKKSIPEMVVETPMRNVA